MKNKLLFLLAAGCLSLIPAINFAQAPAMGTTVDFVLFSSDGAVSNTGITHLTGHVGTNNGSSTGFGNVDGVMHDNDVASAQASADLLLLYGDLNVAIPTFFVPPVLSPPLYASQTVVLDVVPPTSVPSVLTVVPPPSAPTVIPIETPVAEVPQPFMTPFRVRKQDRN